MVSDYLFNFFNHISMILFPVLLGQLLLTNAILVDGVNCHKVANEFARGHFLSTEFNVERDNNVKNEI